MREGARCPPRGRRRADGVVADVVVTECVECSQLRDRIEELERLVGLRDETPVDLPGVGPVAKRFLGLLLTGRLVTREHALAALYGHLAEREQPSDARVVDAHKCRINAALREHGIAVKCSRGQGYYLDADGRRRLEDLLRTPPRADGAGVPAPRRDWMLVATPVAAVARRRGDRVRASVGVVANRAATAGPRQVLRDAEKRGRS